MDDDEELDELDVAETTQRPLMDPVRAGRFARATPRSTSSASVLVDATSEIAAEDILLEVYAEEPPPPMPARRSLVVTPPPSPAPYVAPGFASYEDSPSVAPVAFPSMSMMVAGPVGPSTAAAHHAMSAPTVAPRSRAGLVVGWCAALLVASACAGAIVTIGLKNKSLVHPSVSAMSEAAAIPAKPEPRSVPVTAPPAPTPLPAVSIDSLPQPAIGDNQTLVTFPASAQGHRVFFDGKPMAVTAEPMLLRCGRHNVRIGSAGKVRVTDLTCGREQTLTR